MTSRPAPACPVCRQPTVKQDNPCFPFCSERCQLRDLGQWLKGDYRIPGDPAPIPEAGPEPDSGTPD